MDILDEMTKKELIAWINHTIYFERPKRSWLYFYRWHILSTKALDNQERHSQSLKDIDLKKRDEYAVLFNKTKDTNEKLRLLKLMKPYEDRLKRWIEDGKKLDEEDKRISLLYDKISIERTKEHERKLHGKE